MTARVCHKCGSALGVDDDLCQACGARNPVVHPWYIYPLGFLIVAALFALLVDWDSLWRYIRQVVG
jgi:RNA polymerase subunit RPABC4/transcription elongation factor Spt4